MDRRLVHKKAFHGLEIGLAIEIGLGPLTVAGPHAEGDLIDLTKRAFIKDLPCLAVPGLKAEILVHDQRHACVFRQVGDGLGIAKAFSKRLLTNDGDAPRDRHLDKLTMSWRRRRNVEQVRLAGIQHIGDVAIYRIHIEAVGNVSAHRAVERTEADQIDILDPAPGLIVELREVARASHREFQTCSHKPW